MKWMIGFFVVAIVITQLAFGGMPHRKLAPPPVINFGSGPHQITQQITCLGNNLFTIATYVDGAYLMTTTNRPVPPVGSVTQ